MLSQAGMPPGTRCCLLPMLSPHVIRASAACIRSSLHRLVPDHSQLADAFPVYMAEACELPRALL